MAGYLTTHVLDTALGRPAAGMRITLFRMNNGGHERIADVTTNEDGRTDGPVMPETSFQRGIYELHFHAGEYLRRTGQVTAEPPFLDLIPIRFGLAEDSHYHVPLLLSPHGYSTYRGS